MGYIADRCWKSANRRTLKEDDLSVRFNPTARIIVFAVFFLFLYKELVYRLPMLVVSAITHQSSFGLISFPVCPHCKTSLEREYQSFCDRCGQRLSWHLWPDD